MREFPASPALASAIFLHREAGEATRQNAQLSLSLGESVSAVQLRETWNAVAKATPLLQHGVSPSTGTKISLKETEIRELNWQHLDWSAKERSEIPALWSALQAEEAAKAFSLENPPFIRGTTIDLPGSPCHLLLTFPSFLLDDEAVFALTGRFLAALEGHPLPDGTLSQGTEQVSSENSKWWSDILRNVRPAQVDVRPRPLHIQSGWTTKSVLQTREESRTLSETAAILGLTPHQLFLGVAAIVFGRLSGTAEGLLLANTEAASQLLPARFSLKGEETAEVFLKEVARVESERSTRTDIGLPSLFALTTPPLAAADFTTAFVWSPPLLADRIHDTWMRWMNVDAKLIRPPAAPLTLEVHNAARFLIELHLNQSLFPVAESDRLFDRFLQVLAAVMADPSTKLKDLPILIEGEKATVPGGNGHTPSVVKRIEERFLEVAARQLNDLAVQGDGDAGLTFSEVRDHSRSLAGYLRQENVAEGWMIAICLMPTPWVPVATLGVLLAGDTCVPLNPEGGASWLSERVAACDAEIVICDSQTSALFAGTSRRLLVIDQQWDLISAAPPSKDIAPAPKTAFLLPGTEQDIAPELSAISPTLLATVTKESLSRWRLKPGSRLPLTGAAGTGVYLETLVTSLNSGATLTLSAGRESAHLLATQPTHLRLTEAQWRGLILDMHRGTVAWPQVTRAVCIETHTVSSALFARWQELINEDTATHFFWSPLGNSGLGLRSFTKGRDPQGEPPIGSPTQGITARLVDGCDAELPPHYTGEARLQLADEPSHSWILRAWKDAHGSLHLAPSSDAAERLRHQPEVLDAHVAKLTLGDRPQLGAWVVLTPEAVGAPETVTRDLCHRLPVGERPDFIFTVERFPLSQGGQIDMDTLPKPEIPKKPEPKAVAATPPPASKVQPTAAQPTPVVEKTVEPPTLAWEPIILLHKEPGTPILLLVHDLDGDPEQLRPLANALHGDWTIYATCGQNSGAQSIRVETEAATIVTALQSLDPNGPYHIFGAGYGAILAFEVARQLRTSNRAVHYLALAGASAPALPGSNNWKRSLVRLFSGGAKPTVSLSPAAQARAQAREAYRAPTLEGPAGIILGPEQGRDVENGWLACAPDAFVEHINIPAPQMLTDAGAKRLAVILREWAIPTLDEEG
jgi:pimeloyl-ACP methyl ester carboxylesterase